MSCTYVFKNKEYTESGIKQLISKGGLKLGDFELARENLRKILNMDDSEIELVHGLINNRAVGLFQADGKILLSDSFVQGDEYHEAFHRVFQMMLTEKQQKVLLKEYLNREGAQESINTKKKLYPEYSRDQIIEELLADEFMMYQLADGNYVVPKPIQNFFQRLLNFIRKMLNLRDIETLYSDIQKGRFAAAPVVSYSKTEAESRITINKRELSTDQKNEIIEGVISKFTVDLYEEVANTGSFKNIDLTDKIQKAINDLMNDFKNKKEYGIANAIGITIQEYVPELNKFVLKPNSGLVKGIVERLKLLNIETEFEVLKSENNQADVEAVQDETPTVEAGDYAFMKASWETDPSDYITKSMKLFAASLPNSTPSKHYGLINNYPYATVVNTLYKLLRNASFNWNDVSSILKRSQGRHPWITDLLTRLGESESENQDSRNRPIDKLRNQFMSSFIKVSYPMDKIKYEDSGVQLYSLSEVSNEESMVRELRNFIIKSSEEDFNIFYSNIVNPNLNPKVQAELVLGLSFTDEMLNEQLEDTSGRVKTVREIVSDVLGVMSEALRLGAKPSELLSKKLIIEKNNVKKDYAVVTNLRRVLRVYNRFNPDAEPIVFDHNRNRLYSFTLHTYQKQLESAINSVLDEPVSEEEFRSSPFYREIGFNEFALHKRIERLSQKLKFFTDNPFIFHTDSRGLNTTSSPLLQMWLGNGVRYNIGLFTGVEQAGRGTDAKDLTPSDIIATLFRMQERYTATYFTTKHGDRGNLFTGKFENKGHFLNSSAFDLISYKQSTVNYLVSLLQDELRIVNTPGYEVFKNMGQKNLKIFSYLNIPSDELGKYGSMSSEELREEFENKFTAYIDKQGKEFADYMKSIGFANKNGNWRKYNAVVNKKPIALPYFISPEMYDRYKNEFRDVDDMAEGLIKHVAAKYIVNYNEDIRVFSGYVGEYKDMSTMFKRIQSLSSSGTPLANDLQTNNRTISKNRSDEYTVTFDGQAKTKTYGNSVLKRNGVITEKVFVTPKVDFEMDAVSELPIQDQDILYKVFKEGLMKYDGISEEIANQRAKEYVENFKEYEEPDGATYTNMFFAREYLDAMGAWTYKHENVFQIELAVLNQGKLNPTLWFNPNTYEVSGSPFQYFNESGTSVPAENASAYALGNQFIKELWENHTTSFNMFKPVYTGPVTHKGVTANGIRKTSLHVVLPSMTFGTEIFKKIHDSMLFHDIDLISQDSSAKKAVPSNIQSFNDSEWNFDFEYLSYLDKEYLKEQVKMSPEEHGRIKNATQSTTIILSNLFVDGYPKDLDVANRPLYDQLVKDNNVEELKKLSNVYTKYINYKEALEAVYEKHFNDLQQIGLENPTTATYQNIKELLLNNQAQPHVVDSILLLEIDKLVDLLANFNRIEPAFFSLVTNRTVRIKRPGEMLAQYTVFGMDSTSMFNSETGKFKSSKKLRSYRPVYDATGNLTAVEPPDAIIPVTKSMIPILLGRFKTDNLHIAIQKYNQLPDTEKYIVKSLRIPNQQLSFNAPFRIVEFNYPTMQNYIIAHSAVVPISSSDFDIDKQQVYIPELDNEGNLLDTVYNDLLKSEIDLLLLPENFHHVIAPVNEAWFSKGVYKDVMVLAGEHTAQELSTKKGYDDSVIALGFEDIGSIAKQLNNAYNMTNSKINVGLVAVDAKQYPIGTVDRWGSRSKLNIPGSVDHYYGTVDSKGRHITESISTILTSQVDGVKNPYAVKLNIIKDTLGPILTMVRRLVDVDLAVKIVKTPIVQKYVSEKLFYSSALVKSKKETDSNNPKKRALVSVSNKTYKELQNTYPLDTNIIDEAIIKKAYQGDSIASMKVLAFYTRLEKISSEELTFKSTITPDTKPITSVGQLETAYYDLDNLSNLDAVVTNPRNGFLKKAFEGRDKYFQLVNYYATRTNDTLREMFRTLAIPLANREYDAESKSKVMQTMANDFKAYMYVRKAIEKWGSDVSFETIMTTNKIPDAIKAIQESGSENYFINNIEIIPNIAKEPGGDKMLYMLQLKNRGSSPLHLRDMYDSSSDLLDDLPQGAYPELWRDLVMYELYVANLSYSPFSIAEALHVRFFSAFKGTNILEELQNPKSNYVNEFISLFPSLNPMFFIKDQKVTNSYSDIKYKPGEGLFAGSNMFFEGNQIPVYSNAYVKRYDHTPNLSVFKLNVSDNVSKTATQQQGITKPKGFKLSIDKKGKDQGKADLANALITYPNKGTSSYQYMQDAKKQGVPVNNEIKAGPDVIAMVSVNGNNKATNKQIEDTYLAAREIIRLGGTVIMDSTTDANRFWNASGEALVQEQLGEPTGQTSKGYNYWGKNPEATQFSKSVVSTNEAPDELTNQCKQ